MTGELEAVRDLARSVLADHADTQPAGAAAADPFDAQLWSVLDEVGLTLLSLPEAAGGSGGGLAETGTVLAVAGEHAAAVPLAETDLLAGWLLHLADLPVPGGPLAVAGEPGDGSAGVSVQRDGGSWTVRGRLERVGWARCATALALLLAGPKGEQVLTLDPARDYRVEPGRNLAGEPRDRVVLDARLPAASVAAVAAGTGKQLRHRAALGRALLLAGAGQGALSSTVSYAAEREQFGRPIGRFQAVQQQIALMAAEVAAGRAAADAALHLAGTEGFDTPATAFAVATAKARTSEAAAVIARTAHQVHGALGFTLEHTLRLATTRLWSWRDECGNEEQWHAEIGRAALEAGSDGLWGLVTGAS